ncbi:Ig-like domain-containing protein [Bacillus tianshenii]|nr:Ig-like domain-containing protein [Bacillus tianshenii]
MQRKLLKHLSVLLTVILLVASFSSLSAAAQGTEWTPLEPRFDQPINKTWNISFNVDLQDSSVNSNTVYVKKNDGTKVDTSVSLNGDLITVSPSGSYQYNTTYTLYVGPGIYSTKQVAMTTPVSMQFTTVAAPSVPDTDFINEVQLLPSESIPVGYSDEDIRLTIEVDKSESELAETNETTGISPVALYKETANGWELVDYLFDSGDLEQHADEIRGDRTYSIKLNDKINNSQEADITFKVVVTTKEGTTQSAQTELAIIQTSNGEDVKEVVQTHTKTSDAVKQLANTQVEVKEIVNIVETNLASDANVESYEETEEGVIEVKHTNGLKSMIQIVQEEDVEAGIRSLEVPKADSSEVTDQNREEEKKERVREPKVPIDKQTTGENAPEAPPIETVQLNVMQSDGDYEEIGSRSAFLWAPFQNEFYPWDETEEIADILTSSQLGFNVTKKTNTEADIESLKEMTDYGLVVISTHGSAGKWILTGETVDNTKYEVEQILGQVVLTQHMIVTENNGVKVKEPVYAVNHEWFNKHLDDQFDDTVIVNSSCESTMSDSLWNAFSEKGAGAYYGYDKSVTSKFAYEQSIRLVELLVNEGKTTGDAYFAMPAYDPYYSLNAMWELKGDSDLKFSTPQEEPGVASNLINGSFESSLQGWKAIGDGRAIYSLGSPVVSTPVDGDRMAIISTGLGYTEALGQIEQTFYLSETADKLTFDWNYMSEEFLEYIGSNYDDPFNVTLSSKDGEEVLVLNLTINSLAEQFGASNSYYNEWEEGYEPTEGSYEEPGGDLVPVSPDLIFDVGDVWMTDWQSHSFDIPESFKGQVVTLTFTAADATDTVYDTAVLIDDVRVQAQ